MKDALKIAMCQINIVSLDVQTNRKNIEESFRNACEVAPEEKPDLVIFPELSNSGYVFQRSRDFGNDYMRVAELIPEEGRPARQQAVPELRRLLHHRSMRGTS